MFLPVFFIPYVHSNLNYSYSPRPNRMFKVNNRRAKFQKQRLTQTTKELRKYIKYEDRTK